MSTMVWTSVVASLCQAPVTEPPQQPAPTAPAPAAGAVHPGYRLGARSDGVRKKLGVAPIVVIVSDASSFVEAIGRWTLAVRFPVLVDDGTLGGRENIARFVRAFAPTKVVRWSSGIAAMSDWKAEPRIVDAAVGRAWTLDGKAPEGGFDRAGVLKQWREVQLTPPGVVVAAVDDPAWPAAVALSAGRGEPIFWTTSSRKLDAPWSPAEGDAFEKRIEAFCEESGWTWKGLGDDLDAVTLAMSCQQTIKGGPSGVIATTDRIGRVSAGATDTTRWAWCGQIVGAHAASSYRAMGALFLPTPKDAWVFDSYPTTGEWGNYDGTKSAEILRAALTLKVEVTDSPNGDERHWRERAVTPIDAGLVLVNTKGNKDFFELARGVCRVGDVPILSRPTMVNFVHSWSAQHVGTRDTLSGRWLERGAYAYCGSVEEPTLGGFVPTPTVAGRLAAGLAFGSAVRFDDAPAWRITVLGDPLATFGEAPPPILAAPIPSLEGAIDLGEEVKSTIKSDLSKAVLTLISLGRDEDAARVAAAAGADPGKLSADATLAGALAMFRTGRRTEMRAALSTCDAGTFAKLPEARDAFWFAAFEVLGGTTDGKLLHALCAAARPEQIARDMGDLVDPLKRVFGPRGASEMLKGVCNAIQNPAKKNEAEKALAALRSRLGG